MKTRVLKRAKIAQNMAIDDWFIVHRQDSGETAYLGAVIPIQGHVCAAIRYNSSTYAVPVANLLITPLLNQMSDADQSVAKGWLDKFNSGAWDKHKRSAAAEYETHDTGGPVMMF